MKKIYLSFILLFSFILFLQAENITGCDAEHLISGAEKIWINEVDGSIKYVKYKTPIPFSETALTPWLSQILNAANEDRFVLYKKETDKLGFVHYRYHQYYEDKKVRNAVFYIHTKDQKIVSANGEFIPNIQVNTQAVLSTEAAIEIGKTHIPGNYAWKEQDFPTPELMVLIKDRQPHLVFQTDIYSIEPLNRKYLFIDATTGKIIDEYDRIHHADTHGVAETKYAGTKTMTVDSISPTSFLLNDNGRSVTTWDMNTSTDYFSAVNFTDTDNYWNTTTNKDDAAYDAHWGSQVMYDYLLNVHGRNSFDNSGATINSYIHYGSGYNNAFWDGDGLTYGDGDGFTRDPYTSIDVVGHEIMHAVTEYTAGLIYSYESGALNESFSDIFGIVQDYNANPSTANYLMGDLFNLEGSAIRSMSDPNNLGDPDTYIGNFWNFSSSDNGGVHTNSGVQNYWFYLLIEGGNGTNDNNDNYSVQGIGLDAAADIAYRNLDVYLTPSSQYIDARFFAIEAAVDLFGDCSTEVINTTNSWQAVGVGDVFSNAVVANFQADQVYTCVTPVTISFENFSVNGSSYTWNFGDGTTSTSTSPTHVYSAPGVYTISLITNGVATCGNNDTIVLADYITITNTGGPTAATCSGTPDFPTANQGIFSVNYLNISNSSLGSTSGHEDFTCTQSANVVEGVFNTLQVTTGTSEMIRVWVDLNNDGTFNNTNELLSISSTSSSIHNLNLAIPAGAVYDTPIRLRIKSDNTTSGIVNSCNNPSVGQSEDYTIIVSQNSLPPDADFEVINTTVTLGSTIPFIDKTANAPTNWSWEFTGGFPATSNAQSPNITYNTLGTFPVKLTASNANGIDSLEKISYITVTSVVDICTGTDVVNSPTGFFNDSGGPSGNYTNGENCTFLIQPLCAQTITMTFQSFSTESCCDRLLIYDGVDENAPLLVNAGGSANPGDITTTGGSMYLVFTSDGSVVNPGWEATWSSQVPPTAPVANFSISNTNPPAYSDVYFTDASTNFPYLWTWDFGDGNMSIEQNPIHQYTAPGTYTVQLIVDNCLTLDTTTQMITVQEFSNLTITPTSINAVANCGESTSADITISNMGIGDGLFSINNIGDPFSETSQIDYDFNNVTTHTFVNVSPAANNMSLEIVLNGDFDNSDEFASLYIDGNLIEEMPDGNVTNGTDIVNNYTFDAATIAPWVADGVVEIVIQNSIQVDLSVGNGLDYHRATIEIEGLDWISISPIQGGISPNGSAVVTVDFIGTDLVAGIYTEEIELVTNDPNQLLVTIPVTFEVLGTPEIVFPITCLDFLSIMENTSLTLPLSISNPGCDTLEISNIFAGNPFYTTDLTQLNILPFGIDTVMVTFAPTSVGVANTTLDFTTNAGAVSLCLTGNSFDAPTISVQPTSLNLTLDCGQDTIIPIDVINSGLGQLIYNADNLGSDYSDSSTIVYDFINGGTTTHSFPNISSNANNLTIEVTLNGDFDVSFEFASVFIDGVLIEQIIDGDPFNGTDITVTYNFDAATIAPWVADGEVVVEVVNSNDVDPGNGGTDTHKVKVTSNGVDWADLTPSSGTVAANSSQTLNLNISSAGLSAGNYTAEIIFNSNDPLNPVVVFPIDLTIVGQPEISFSSACLDFPTIMQYTSDTLPLVITNTGCSLLDITNIIPGASEYGISFSQTSIAPFSTDTLTVIFSPTTVGTFNTDLQFTNNAGQASVCLTGSSFGAPAISATPSPITVNLNSCNDSITVPVTISNTGLSDLDFQFLGSGNGAGNSTLDSVKSRFNNSFSEITDLLPNTFLFSNGVTGSSIGDGGNDMYDTGNFLNIDNTTNLFYSDDVIISNPALGSGGQYFTKKHPGIFVFAADINNISSFDITGNLGADGSGTAAGSVLDYNHNGINYKGFVKKVFDSFDPSVNHLVIVRDQGGSASHNFSTSTDNDQHSVEGISGADRIYYLLFAGSNGLEYSDAEFLAVMAKFLEITETGGFVDLPQGNYTVGASQSEVVDLTFSTNNVAGGMYNSIISVGSNDPLQPFYEIPVILNVSFDLCADFNFDLPIICGGQVDFTSTTTNTPTSYLWDFGDGNTSTQANPTHIYTAPGSYSVLLTVTNSSSTDMISYTVVINETSAPLAACDVTSTNTFPSREIVTFTLNTIDNSTFGDNSTYSDFTCDINTTMTIGNDYDYSIICETTLNHDSKLWIDLNNNGIFEATELLVTTENQTSPHTGTITIPMGESGVPLRCRVGIDDDFSILEACDPSDFGEFEDYTVFLESNTSPPIANFTFNSINDCQGVVQFTDLSGNFPTGWIWDFGDGTTSGLQNPIHTFATAGIYTVTLTTTNSFGTNLTSFNVTVNSLNPIINVPTILEVNTLLAFSANAPGAISWTWNFGDGNTATGQNVEHNYAAVGQYVVTLTVTNGIGCQNSTVETINVIMTGIEEISNQIKIYPNPSEGDFIIENKSGSAYHSFEVFNSVGQLIHQMNIQSNQEKYNLYLNHLPDGVYWIKLSFDENEQLVKKLTIVKD